MDLMQANAIVSRISKGSRMDQIYIPKNRVGFGVGNYVVIKLIGYQEEAKLAKQKIEKPFLYGLKKIEPIKLEIIDKIFLICSKFGEFENIIVTGSFLNEGFDFGDVDIILICEDEIKTKSIEAKIGGDAGIKTHIISLSPKGLINGLASDPLYENMLSKCIAKKRLVFNVKRKFNAPLLDLNLLKSKALITNFEKFNGKEKYYLAKNMVAIKLFTENKKVNEESINREIRKLLKVEPNEIKENMLKEKEFIKKYKYAYDCAFKKILSMSKKQNMKMARK